MSIADLVAMDGASVDRGGPVDATAELPVDAEARDAGAGEGVSADASRMDATTDAAAGYAIGSTSLEVGSAKVPLQAYYPATAATQDAPVAAGSFPVLLFAHGYQQSPGDYAYIWKALVPRGVIVLLHDRYTKATTIDIDVYASDLVSVLDYLAGPARAPGAFFAGHLGAGVGVGGHSTGGGASVLAAVAAKAAGSAEPAALLLLAPLGTTNAVIYGTHPHVAAKQLAKPLLILDAVHDCLARIATNSKLIYDATPSAWPASLKVRVTAKAGDHCGYSDCAGPGKGICEGGEALACAFVQPPTLAPCEQNALAGSLLVPWFLWQVAGDVAAEQVFTQALADPRVSHESS